MDRDQIRALLVELGRRLDADGIQAEMYVVGGAAIALAFDARRSTRDIDAVFEPKAAVYAEASRMARELDLEQGWLNDGVKGFLEGPDADAAVALEAPGIRVSTASPRILLALKVLAHRVGQDEDDVRVLADEVGATTAEAVLQIASDVYGDRLDAASRFFVEELFSS